MKWPITRGGLVLLFILLAGCQGTPPKESKLLSEFQSHRVAYEQLRDMLQADNQVLSISPSGIETTQSGGLQKLPKDGNFPVDRYNQYIALLKEVGAAEIFRWGGQRSKDVGFAIWGSGWGGDTRHIALAWIEHEPTNQVSSLDAFYQSPKPRNPTFRHIDGNWYLWADW